MYSRKIKVGKKKSKSGGGKPNDGSSWGPRLALYEREQASQQQYVQKPPPLQQQQHYNHHKVVVAPGSSSASTTYSHHYSQNNSHYNHHHRQNSRKDDPSSSVINLDASHNYYGSSSVSSSSHLPNREGVGNSGTKLPSSGPHGRDNTNLNLSKPLSVIIPPPDRFKLNSGDCFGPDRDSSVPSTKTWRSSPDQLDDDRHQNYYGMDERETRPSHQSGRIPPPPEFNVKSNPQNNMKKKPIIYEQQQQGEVEQDKTTNGKYVKTKQLNKEFETSNKLSHHQGNKKAVGGRNGTTNDEMDENEGARKKMNGSTISALAQGMTMVYVPMEAATRNLRNKGRSEGTKSPEQQAVENLQAKIDEPHKNLNGHSHKSHLQPQEQQQLNHHQQQQKNGSQSSQNDERKDPDGDSLLESFDSVIFKPKTMMNNCQPNFPSSIHIPGIGVKNIDSKIQESLKNGEKIYPAFSCQSRRKQQISESPPPLPPPNGSKPKKPDKNLRFSEQLENFQNSFEKVVKQPRLGKKVPIPTTPDLMHHSQDTQSMSTDIVDLKKCHVNPPDNNKNSENSFVLSCGHMRSSSSYSTLSSVTSTLTGDDEDVNSGRDPRSALQQLRDLSLLIGGNFHSSSIPNKNGTKNGQQSQTEDLKTNHNEIIKKDTTIINKTRRDSEGSSGIDSGQGSGQSPTDESPNLGKTSNGSYPSSCAFSSKGDCEDCFMVFKNPLAIDSSSSHSCSASHSTSASPSDQDQDRCENHHRHFIIHDQSRLKQSTGKNRSVHSQFGRGHGGSKKSSKKSKKHKKNHDDLVLEYCDCSQCHCDTRRDGSKQDSTQENLNNNSSNTTTNNNVNSNHSSSKVNGSSSELLSSGNCNNGGDETSNNHNHNKRISHSTTEMHPPHIHHNSTTNLFTIDEEEVGDVPLGGIELDFNTTNQSNNNFMDVTIKEFNHDDKKDHWHPKCWLASDPNMGWSDLESLYSQNMKLDKPVSINDECWTCWKDVAENRRNATDPNRTVDRTKRMFIWLNKRHQEFNAPWWEAKKQASIRWLVTKAFAHLPKEAIGDPFKESKKGKAKYRLKDEVIKGLVNGKLYCMTLDHLYQNQHYRSRGLTHWDIIKILSRKGVYVAQPSDMKLTEGTLRQKPLRIAAHVALVEAMMGLYCKEILNRDRILATLNSFCQTIDPETNASAEQLLIAWINAAMLTLKSYILSNKNQNQKLPSDRLNRWLNIPQVEEIRDLCDGVGICSLFALYCSNDLQVSEISVPEPNEMLNIYETIENHSIIERLCRELFPESIYHLFLTDFIYIHGYMKQNILMFLVDLFNHLEVNPVSKVNRLTHVPIRIDL